MGAYGDQLRAKIEREYDVEGTAAATMIDAIVETANELELLQTSVQQNGVLIDGAHGQKVANPALAAIARHRSLLEKLIGAAFPGEKETTSEKAARAARARWDKSS